VPAGSGGSLVTLRRAGAALRLGWQAEPRQLSAMVMLTVLDGVIPVGSAWSVRALLDALGRRPGTPSAVLLPVAALAVFGALTLASQAAGTYLQTVLQRSIRVTVEARLFTSIHALPGLADFEDPQRLNRIQLAEQAGESAPGGVINSVMELTAMVITGAGFVLTLAYLVPWLVAAAAAAAVPAVLLQLRLARLRADMTVDISQYHRRLLSYRVLATDVRAAKEVRLFGLGRFLTGRMLRDLGRANATEAAVDRTAARMELALAGLTGLVTLFGAVMAVRGALAGRLTVGDVTVILAAMVALQGIVTVVTTTVSDGYRSLLLFGQYQAVVDEAAVPPGGAEAAPLQHGIEFSDVWFRYAPELPWVLRGMSCLLPAGLSVGLVGLNGAGKTTMIKLLCRLYEPERGCIRWDGIDIRLLDPASLRRRISAVFQDYMSYDLSAADNIGVGALEYLDDQDAISRAAALAGADTIVAALPHGYQTMLSRIFPADDGGRNATLSGGQWQRIALARAFLRTDADVLILDEPSSGLDAQVEHALHQTLGTLRTGRLSLLISHRLNALTSADLILMVENGQITERGTHRQLASAGGSYAGLFALQAAGYEPVDGPAGPA
jgi:ATP-binding cassette subfamily B protein